MILESVKLDTNTQDYGSSFLTIQKTKDFYDLRFSILIYIDKCRRLKNVENVKISAKRKSNNPNSIAPRTALPPAVLGADGSLPLVTFLEL